MLHEAAATEQWLPRRWLFRPGDDRPFAFELRRAYLRCSDRERWAEVVDNQLVSARSGRRLAYRVGHVYYDTETHVPLYVERGTRNPWAKRD
jgi:hypothetical protein